MSSNERIKRRSSSDSKPSTSRVKTEPLDKADSDSSCEDDTDGDEDYDHTKHQPNDSDSENEVRVAPKSPLSTQNIEPLPRPAAVSLPQSPSASLQPASPSASTSSADNLQPVAGKKRVRKRTLNKDQWERNIKSAKYNSGERFVSKGVEQERKIGDRCGCKRLKCFTVSDDQRLEMHSGFWQLKSAIGRQNYIVSRVRKFEKKRALVESTKDRGNNQRYFLPTNDKAEIQVCKKFFLSTLCISDRMVNYNLCKSDNGVRSPPAPRAPHNKFSEEILASVKSHISSFPKVESHYCRKTTKREYLEPGLNKTKMYELYKSSLFFHASVKKSYYGHVFDTEYNLGFHQPSSDVCDFCALYTSKEKECSSSTPPIPIPENLLQQKLEHDNRKDSARKEKEKDKNNENILAITFDLQQVLTCPKLSMGSCYYKRKLNVYNLTFYELQSKDGYCYTWHEGECSRGGNEIASCIVKHLKKIDAEGKYQEVVLYSDTCGGQNRNRIVCTAITNFLKESTNINLVQQKFFETGHSHMECDSMHSAIETAIGKSEIGLPSDYQQLMRLARRKQPYYVVEITHDDINDYEALNSKVMRKDAFAGIIKCHHLKYEKDPADGDPKIHMTDTIGKNMIPVSYRKRGGQQSLLGVEKAYSVSPGIDVNKRRDLLSMIHQITAQTVARLFYESLPTRNVASSE